MKGGHVATFKFKIKTYFHNRGFYEYRRGWDKGTCLFCGSEDKAGVNVSRDFYHCFVCEERDSLLNVLMSVEGIKTTKEALVFLGELKPTPFKVPKVDRIQPPERILPEGFTSIKRGTGEIRDRAYEYMVKGRGISEDRIFKASLGYTPDPSDKFFGRILIPFLREGKCVWFQGRSFLPYSPKIQNPEIESTGLGKNLVIYNHDALDKYSEIDVTESAFNALTQWPSAIGMNGKVVSLWQFSQLVKANGVKVYNIMLDDDALKYAWDLALKLIPFKAVRVLDFPPKKDVNDLGQEWVEEKKSKTPILSSKMDLQKYRRLMK